jgi:pimeloyl-ACP methyl ester carboxylesterase
MKRTQFLLGLIFILISSSSCTVLQWRKSDKEIQQKFNELEIPSEISYFEVDSLNLNVRIQEIKSESKNINLVFLHGAPSSISTWEGYLTDTTLLAKANMYAIDRPDYGYSNFGKEIPSIKAQVNFFNSIFNEKELENFIAIGSSYGGPIAARIAVLNPNVKAVIMISPAIDPTIEKYFWAGRFTQWKLMRWMVPTAYRVAGDEKEVHAEELSLIEKDWNSLTIPVIHIHGEDDTIVPYENIYYSKKNFQDIKLISIPEKGHEISYKNTEMVIPSIVKLIDQIEREN